MAAATGVRSDQSPAILSLSISAGVGTIGWLKATPVFGPNRRILDPCERVHVSSV